MKEGKVARNPGQISMRRDAPRSNKDSQVVLDPSSNVQNVNLAIEDVLCLLEAVVCRPRGTSFNLVKARCEV